MMREPRSVAVLGAGVLTLVMLMFATFRVTGTDTALARNLDAPTGTATPQIQAVPDRVVIPEGTLPGAIVDILGREAVVADVEALRTLMLLTDSGSALLAGEYTLGRNLPPAEALRRLLAGPDRFQRITFRPGLRVEEIGETLEREGIFTVEAWASAVASTPPRDFMAGEDLLGYLMPGTYEVDDDTTAEALLAAMLDRFAEEVTPELIAEAQVQGWSLSEVLTLASIVVREAALDVEKPLVASVFRNRLEDGIPLQADPTVQYALTISWGGEESVREYGWWKQELTVDDLALDSLFNTYVYPGLFPAPIANPDIASIRAVVRPAATDYYYFVVAPACDGTHLFARTLEEHSVNVEAFRASACGQGG